VINLTTTSRQSLTIPEVRELLNKPRRTIYYWIETGKLPVIRTADGSRVPIGAVRALAHYLATYRVTQLRHRVVCTTSRAKSA
jgi:excisionase family DNA binding protein